MSKAIKGGMLGAVGALALAGCMDAYSTDVATAQAEATAPAAGVELMFPPERAPSELQVLFWDKDTRSQRFRNMENWFAGHEIPAATNTRELPYGVPLSDDLQSEIKSTMQASNTVGVMVLQNGKVRFEDYIDGMESDDRWTSFSVAKSFTSTLLGAAVRDGHIASIDDPVTQYIPDLAGSAYEGVTVKQLATMTSGVAWNEDYSDPNSDVAQMNRFVVEYGPKATITQMKALEREAEPGTKWVYKTGETNLIGLLVENAIGMTMAEYVQSKIVEPAGFEGDMFWMTDPRGGNIGGCCLSLRLSDYARMGQFALEGGDNIVADDWFAEATSAQEAFGTSGFGYGYQWWTYPGENYGAQGIFGQGITMIPEKQIVVAYIGNWSQASGTPHRGEWLQLAAKIAAEN